MNATTYHWCRSCVQALITHDPMAWAAIQAASESWSADEDRTTPTVVADVTDGELFLSHPKLGRKSGPIPCPELGGKRLKLAFKAYYGCCRLLSPLQHITHAGTAFGRERQATQVNLVHSSQFRGPCGNRALLSRQVPIGVSKCFLSNRHT